MEKSKGPVLSTLNTYWNLALLARGFDLETKLPPEVCAERLADLHQPYRLLKFDLASRTTAQVTPHEDGYSFDLRIKRRNRGVDYTSVKATGRIVHSAGLEATLIRGTIKLGWLFMLTTVGAIVAVIVGLLMVVLFEGIQFGGLLASLGIMGAVALWVVLIIQTDYRILTQRLAGQLAAVDVRETGRDLFEDEAEALHTETPNQNRRTR